MKIQNVLIAMDSFKGSVSSLEASNAVASGVKEVFPDSKISICSVGDGGEGTLDAILEAVDGKKVYETVSDPLGREIEAYYGVLEKENVVVVELASASGLTLVDKNERNPLYTTTYGFGELIRAAIKNNYRRFIVCLGGSATNDCGVGLLQALGFSFKDKNGNEVQRGAIGLRDIVEIDCSNKMKELSECSFVLASDVQNPLYGENGCSHVFAKQKGASNEEIEKEDEWIRCFSNLSCKILQNANPFTPGAGAAGGVGFAFQSYLNAQTHSGIEIVLETIKAEDKIAKADIVITGEGQLDGQSMMGKLPIGIAKIAKKYHKPVIALAGSLGTNIEKLNDFGIDSFFPIVKTPCSLSQAMDKTTTEDNLKRTTKQVFNLFKIS